MGPMHVSDAIPLTRVDLKADEIEAISRLLRNADDGTAVDAFEQAFCAYLDRPYCVSTTSGGTAVEIALAAYGVHNGDEVLMPAVGASAAVAATTRLGATPVCVDVDPQTLCMSAKDAEPLIGERTRAIVSSADLGCPAGVDGLARLATKAEVPMVELVGTALGAKVAGETVGHFGRIAVFDLSPASPLCTGTGGAIVTNDDHLATTMRALRCGERAFSPDGSLAVGAAAFDATMDDLRASLGLARLGGIESAIEARKEIAASYFRRLGGNSELILQTSPDDVDMSWCRMIVRLSDQFSMDERDEITAGLARHDIGSNSGLQLASDSIAPVEAKGTPWPLAERAAARAIALPMHSTLGDREVDLVCQTLELMMQRTSFRRD